MHTLNRVTCFTLLFRSIVFTLAAWISAPLSAANCDSQAEVTAFLDSVAGGAQYQGLALANGIDRSDLRPAWETLLAGLQPGLLDLCGSDLRNQVAEVPPAGSIPGAVVRVRPVVPSPFHRDDAIAAKVVYVTQTEQGLAYAMTLVIVPADAVVQGVAMDQFVFNHGTSGFNIGCDQYIDEAYMLGVGNGFGYVIAIDDIVGSMLDADKIVQLPYYVGIGLRWNGGGYKSHPYFSRDTTARTVIDAARAVYQLGATNRWAVGGHSQGGHASLAAARLAPLYAPELELEAVVAAAPPMDIEASFDYMIEAGLDPEDTYGLTPAFAMWFVSAGLWGLQADFPAQVPNPLNILSNYLYWDSRQLLIFNSLGEYNPYTASLLNSGQVPWYNWWTGQYFPPGPNVYPTYTSNDMALAMNFTPAQILLETIFASAYWPYQGLSIPRPERVTSGCWGENATGSGSPVTGVMTLLDAQTPDNTGAFFKPAYADINASAWANTRSVLGNQSVVDQVLTPPTLVISGYVDNLVPTGDPQNPEPFSVWAGVNQLCANGSRVVHLPVAGGHAEALVSARQEAIDFVLDAFNGVPATGLCN